MVSNKNKRLIILAHASTGSGHQMAAEAIAEALSHKLPNAEIKVVDIIDYYCGKLTGNDFVSASSGFLAPAFDFA